MPVRSPWQELTKAAPRSCFSRRVPAKTGAVGQVPRGVRRLSSFPALRTREFCPTQSRDRVPGKLKKYASPVGFPWGKSQTTSLSGRSLGAAIIKVMVVANRRFFLRSPRPYSLSRLWLECSPPPPRLAASCKPVASATLRLCPNFIAQL